MSLLKQSRSLNTKPGQCAHPAHIRLRCMANGARPCLTSHHDASITNRRSILQSAALLATLWPALPSAALPLAPLGQIKRIGGDKRIGLSPEEVKDILAADIGKNMYFVTGNLTKEIFSDECSFEDPTNAVTGLARYVKALGILFDPDWSKVLLTDIRVTGPNTIEADWRLGGWLKTQYFPWQPKVEPFSGHTVYTLDSDGLIVRQYQTWSITGAEALKETFTPVPGPRQQLL